jgi:hydroxymethylbilane synthase
MSQLNHAETALCVGAERHVNHLLGGNCHTPLAVYCVLKNNQLLLQAKLATANGATVITDTQRGQAAQANVLARACAQNLLRQGGEAILNTITQHD